MQKKTTTQIVNRRDYSRNPQPLFILSAIIPRPQLQVIQRRRHGKGGRADAKSRRSLKDEGGRITASPRRLTRHLLKMGINLQSNISNIPLGQINVSAADKKESFFFGRSHITFLLLT